MPPSKLSFGWFATAHGESGESKGCALNRKRTLQLFQSGSFKSHECRRHFATQFSRCDSTVYKFLFLRSMSSSSSDSEISFDSEDSEIYYIAEAKTEENDESRLSISQTSSDDDQADLYADDPLADEEWEVKHQKEVDTDKDLERTLNDRLEGKVEIIE